MFSFSFSPHLAHHSPAKTHYLHMASRKRTFFILLWFYFIHQSFPFQITTMIQHRFWSQPFISFTGLQFMVFCLREGKFSVCSRRRKKRIPWRHAKASLWRNCSQNPTTKSPKSAQSGHGPSWKVRERFLSIVVYRLSMKILSSNITLLLVSLSINLQCRPALCKDGSRH